jgi:lipopolysaccharide biosynthesis protein
MKPRIIAIYLPQFHPIPENDEWWGKGFTEWRNVVKTKPRFLGHYQPHLPADLGFYDLRVPEVRIEQAKMAHEHGIYGFCYYHYWFNGHLLLERPLEEILKSKEPDFPFMICWANENWTRVWDGGEKKILIEQKYSEEDDVNHIHYLMQFFKDPRYIRVNNKPVISIYRSALLPNLDKTTEIWRTEALKEGIELYICRFESFMQNGKEYMVKGIDAAIDFEPHTGIKEYQGNNYIYFIRKTINYLFRLLIKKNILPDIINYKKYVRFHSKNNIISLYKKYPCVIPMFDNCARRKNTFFAFHGSTPELFGMWLKNVIEKFIPYSDEENFIFINAWNEWAEGNHLEPCIKWGARYLKEVKKLMEIL